MKRKKEKSKPSRKDAKRDGGKGSPGNGVAVGNFFFVDIL